MPYLHQERTHTYPVPESAPRSVRKGVVTFDMVATYLLCAWRKQASGGGGNPIPPAGQENLIPGMQ